MAEAKTPKVVLDKPVQIGLVVRDAEKTARRLSELFGVGPFRMTEWPLERPDMRFEYQGQPGHLRMKLAFAKLGPIEIELIQPLDGDSDYHHFLAEKGGGLHHILFDVPDSGVIVSALQEEGIGVLQAGTGLRPGTRWIYLDTEDEVGFRVELRNTVAGSDGTSPVPAALAQE